MISAAPICQAHTNAHPAQRSAQHSTLWRVSGLKCLETNLAARCGIYRSKTLRFCTGRQRWRVVVVLPHPVQGADAHGSPPGVGLAGGCAGVAAFFSGPAAHFGGGVSCHVPGAFAEQSPLSSPIGVFPSVRSFDLPSPSAGPAAPPGVGWPSGWPGGTGLAPFPALWPSSLDNPLAINACGFDCKSVAGGDPATPSSNQARSFAAAAACSSASLTLSFSPTSPVSKPSKSRALSRMMPKPIASCWKLASCSRVRAKANHRPAVERR